MMGKERVFVQDRLEESQEKTDLDGDRMGMRRERIGERKTKKDGDVVQKDR